MFATAALPCRERRQGLVQGRLQIDAELLGEQFGVATLDRVPERGVGTGFGARGGLPSQARPVAFVLEGVGRQFDGPGTGRREERRPVDGNAVHPQPGQGRDGAGGLGPFAVQHGDGERVVAARLLDGGHEGGVRAQLHETGHTQAGQVCERVGEAHGAAHLVRPVRGGELLDRLAGEGGHDRHLGTPHLDPVGNPAELLQHRLHQRRVEGVTDLQPTTLMVGQPGSHRFDGLASAGEHDLARRVHRRHRHALHQQRSDLLQRGPDRPHRTALGQRLHQPGTSSDQLARVRQQQHAGHMRSRQLTHRVADEVIRRDAPRLHQPEQRHLDREQRRLRPPGLPQRLPIREHHIPQRTVQQSVEVRTHLIQRIGEHRERLRQLPAHTETLTTLTREHEPRQTRTYRA